MIEYKVLITTSGIGSRLGELTDYTNKCLINVGNKPVISHIIEKYPIDTKFVITLGHYGSYVKQFLALAYPTLNFTFIDIDKYVGEGSSLGYSILQCKKILQCPFIFHASDTIVENFDIPELDTNWVVGSYKEDSSQYRTLTISDNKLVKVNEKGELKYDFTYIGIIGVKDFDIFFYNLERLVNNGHVDTSDIHVVNNMLCDVEFLYKNIEIDDWFDTGNVIELIRTRNKFKNNIVVLDKKYESIFLFDEFVIKFFTNKTTVENRTKRAINLKGLVPEIISSTDNFYKYKKVHGENISNIVTTNMFKDLLSWSMQQIWVSQSCNIDEFRRCCKEFYLTKSIFRVNKFLENHIDITDCINDINVPSVMELLQKIDIKWLSDGNPVQFHGDFILDNIIKTKDSFCLIDWREDFQGNLYNGDIYYDLAKLNHNLIVNHEIVNKKLYTITEINNKKYCKILCSSMLIECQEILYKFILDNNLDLKKVKILTSIIWINMAPLHEYPFNKFLFYFGKYNLYKQLNNE